MLGDQVAAWTHEPEVFAIPTFTDNYVWLIARDGRAVVVDPGEAGPVRESLARRGLALDSILVTHHHPDHVGGIAELLASAPDPMSVPVYGPRAEAGKIGTLTRVLDDGDLVTVLDVDLRVIAIPGHTLGHIAFHAAAQKLLFCGDTLFAGGCGRLFEGTPWQMYDSLSRLAELPAETAVYCAHEYTLSNLAFAKTVEPGNAEIAAHLARMRALRADQQPTLPSHIGIERAVNPFLRAAVPAVRGAAEAHAGSPFADGDATAVFAALRRWKDDFRPSADF